jgi:hypothetical protein
MQHRTTVAVALPAIFALAALSPSSGLQAQASAGRRPSPAAIELGSLSRERAYRWADRTPIVHCAPAPLTERPGAAAELARPRVVPLEQTFLDAASVKRTLARAPRRVGR